MKKNNKKVNGYVEKITTSPAKFGGFSHRIYIRKKSYSLFNDSDLCLVKQGDLVEFTFLTTGKSRKYSKIEELSIELLNPTEYAQNTAGYVYVMSNPSMPGLLKIGQTTRTPQERADELYHQATGVPVKFKVEWFLNIDGDPLLVEQKAHAFLNHKSHGKEFFKATLEEAKKFISAAYQELYPSQALENDIGGIIDIRTSDIDARRQALAEEHEKKKKKDEEKRLRKEYEQSDEYRWLKNGSVEVKMNEVKGEKKFTHGLLDKWLKPEPEDWFEASIMGRISQNDEVHEWHVVIRGGKGWDFINLNLTDNNSPDIYGAFKVLESEWQKYGITNVSLSITIPTAMIVNVEDMPPPEKYWEKLQLHDISFLKINGIDQNKDIKDIAFSSLSSLPASRIETFIEAFF